jgi:hypothetical protein
MPRPARIVACILLLMSVPALQVLAGERPDASVRVRGLVVSSRNGLTINDGTRDFLLLGVDDIGIEGRVCVVTGTLVRWRGRPAIRVLELRPVPEPEVLRDTVGTGPHPGPHHGPHHGPHMVSQGATIFTLSTAQAA